MHDMFSNTLKSTAGFPPVASYQYSYSTLTLMRSPIKEKEVTRISQG